MNKEVGGKLPLISEDKQNTRHGRRLSQTISTRMTLAHQLHILKEDAFILVHVV